MPKINIKSAQITFVLILSFVLDVPNQVFYVDLTHKQLKVLKVLNFYKVREQVVNLQHRSLRTQDFQQANSHLQLLVLIQKGEVTRNK